MNEWNEFDPKKETQQCIQWIQNWFKKESGDAKGAIIGISGGKDSTVVAGLLCKAIGKENVLGLLLPNGLQKDIQDAKRVCAFLQIPHHKINVGNAYNSLISSIPIPLSSHTKTNIPPRLRMTLLYALGQNLNYRVAGTGNLSERYVGYSTKWGDAACDFNPIANFTTTQVIAIGKELGLPYDLLTKPPQDGLSGKTDEDNLGFSYEQLNEYIKTGHCTNEASKGKIEQLHHYNSHKLQPIPLYTPSYFSLT